MSEPEQRKTWEPLAEFPIFDRQAFTTAGELGRVLEMGAEFTQVMLRLPRSRS